jgi:excinuclease ABC subunit C
MDMEQNASERSRQRIEQVKEHLRRILPEDAFFFDSARYPAQPGCYLMKNRRGTVIYVGKAKNLRDRLSSYFHSNQRDARTEHMVRRVRDIEVILVNNEFESLVLENNLIKHYKPHYNARLKADDSGYFYIIQTTEKLPRLLPYMRSAYSKEIERIGGNAVNERYGPYLSRRFRDLLLEFVVDHFGIRTCSVVPKKVCLRYEIQRCCGVCAGLVTNAQYMERLAEAAVFLSYEKADRVEHTMELLRQHMQEHADRLEFESAQRIYDRIQAIEKLRLKQIVERDLTFDQDVLYFGEQDVLVMQLRKGAVLKFNWHQLERDVDTERMRKLYILRHYRQKSPRELIVNAGEMWGEIEQILSANNKKPVRIVKAITEEARDLMKLCQLNYDYRATYYPL